MAFPLLPLLLIAFLQWRDSVLWTNPLFYSSDKSAHLISPSMLLSVQTVSTWMSGHAGSQRGKCCGCFIISTWHLHIKTYCSWRGTSIAPASLPPGTPTKWPCFNWELGFGFDLWQMYPLQLLSDARSLPGEFKALIGGWGKVCTGRAWVQLWYPL